MILLASFLIILLFCSAYCSASETALFSLSSTKIKAYHTAAAPRKRLIAQLVSRPRDLIVTIFMLNTLANVMIQNVTSSIFGEEASWNYKVVVPFLLTFFIGEIIPKNFGLENNERIANLVAPSINFLQNMIRPIRSWTVKITVPISRMLFCYLKPDESISKDELKHVMKTSLENGLLRPEEAELVWGYLKLQDSTIKAIMRPREDIISYDIHDPLTKLTHIFTDRQCSRLPVCDETLDQLIGVITARQYFLNRAEIESTGDVRKHLAKPLYVPENMPARALLKRFNETGMELAIAVDEYGTVSGLITKEDLVEQVIGDISDQRDEQSLFTSSGPHEIIASGRMELSTFNEYFGTDLSSAHHILTIGGWLVDRLDEIPKSGTKVTLDGFVFHILASGPTRIKRIFIRKI